MALCTCSLSIYVEMQPKPGNSSSSWEIDANDIIINGIYFPESHIKHNSKMKIEEIVPIWVMKTTQKSMKSVKILPHNEKNNEKKIKLQYWCYCLCFRLLNNVTHTFITDWCLRVPCTSRKTQLKNSKILSPILPLFFQGPFEAFPATCNLNHPNHWNIPAEPSQPLERGIK